MSNIVKTKEDLAKLKEYIKIIQTKWLNKDTMGEILDGIIPTDALGNKLVNVVIKKDGRRTALFLPKYNTVEFSIDKCKQFVIANIEDLDKFYSIKDKKSFGYYLSLFIMLHEVEHAYQRLIGQGKVECDIPVVKNGYRELNELMINPNYILPRPIKVTRRYISLMCYIRNQEKYALERNANVEAFSALLALAYDSGNEEMIKIFTDMTQSYMCIGYEDDSKGVFYHTFKDILMMDKYRRFCDETPVSDEDRIRYGLEIPDYKRLELLSKIKRRTNLN